MDEQQPAKPRQLTQEERNDLRLRVLRGEALTLDEARQVFESMRQGAAIAAMPGDKPKRKGSKRKQAMSDDQLSASLDSALGL